MDRLSINSDDPGHNSWLEIHRAGQRWVFTVDDVEQPSVVTADFKKGYLIRHVMDDEGRPKINRLANDVMQERVRGEVKLEVWDGEDLILRLPEA